MLYRMYKFHFDTPVRFGSGASTESQMVFHADTLFSALYLACMEIGKEAAFISMVREGAIRFSDAFPYHEETLYLPRPIGLYPSRIQTEIDASTRKILKKIAWIPWNSLSEWLDGKVSPLDLIVHFGVSEERIRVNRREQPPMPYTIESFRFFDNCGLYVIAAVKDEETFSCMDDAMQLLGTSGIGGSTSSGLGHYTLTTAPISESMEKALADDQASWQMLLNVAFPSESEANVMEEARYMLLRRGGFTAGRQEQPVKKQTAWLMAPGSVFRKRFDGMIEDASIALSSHPVWRYEKALMMGVNAE